MPLAIGVRNHELIRFLCTIKLRTREDPKNELKISKYLAKQFLDACLKGLNISKDLNYKELVTEELAWCDEGAITNRRS